MSALTTSPKTALPCLLELAGPLCGIPFLPSSFSFHFYFLHLSFLPFTFPSTSIFFFFLLHPAFQLFLKHPSLASWDFFLPSPALLQLLMSRLFSGPSQVPCVLPKNLGQLVPVASITSEPVFL